MFEDSNRSRRVGVQLQRVLAQLIQREIKDPRLGMVTVSAVDVTRDLSRAYVYVTVLEGKDINSTLEILNKAAGYLRHEASRRMVIRGVPAIKFIYDGSVKYGTDLSSLIDKAVSIGKDQQN